MLGMQAEEDTMAGSRPCLGQNLTAPVTFAALPDDIRATALTGSHTDVFWATEEMDGETNTQRLGEECSDERIRRIKVPN